MRAYTPILAFAIILSSCGNSSKHTTSTTIEDESAVVEETPKTIFGVIEESDIFEAPNSSEKVLNAKATEAFGEVQYCHISRDCSVKILDRNGEWVKIQVVDPDWLSTSHIGWVKSSCIESDNQEQLKLEEGQDYIVMDSTLMGNMRTYYIKNITCDINESDLYRYARAIQNSKGGNCNIQIFTSDKVKDLMKKYPLKGQEYITVADELAYEISFDGSYSYYPLQDIQYKEFGGSNWKKQPL